MKKAGIIKLMIQNEGIFFNEDLIEGYLDKYNHSGDKIDNVFFYFHSAVNTRIPVYTFVGIGGYAVQVVEGRYYVNVDGHKIQIYFYDNEEFHKVPFDSHRCLGDIIKIKADGHLAITFSHNCKYIATKQKCKFCNIDRWSSQTNGQLIEIIKATKIYQKLNAVRHISITSGTGGGKDKGLPKVIDFIKNIRLEGIDLPIAIEIEPICNYTLIENLKCLGVTTISCNLEFMGDTTRLFFMPGKGHIPFSAYEEMWSKCVMVFGKNQVYTNILLSSNDDADIFVHSAKTIVDLGAMPSIGVMLQVDGAEIESVLPKLDVQIQYFEEISNYIRCKGLNPTMAKAGCIKNGGYSPLNEFYNSTEI